MSLDVWQLGAATTAWVGDGACSSARSAFGEEPFPNPQHDYPHFLRPCHCHTAELSAVPSLPS